MNVGQIIIPEGWTFPARFLQFYQAEIRKGQNRIIDIGLPESIISEHHLG